MWASAAVAQTAGETDADALFDALLLPEITQIMQQEGLNHGAQIAVDMFPDRSGAEWATAVESIYDVERMTVQARADFAASLKDADLTAVFNYFETAPGATFVSLEVSARAAMLDEAVKTASEEAAAIAMQDRGTRFQLIAEFVEVNDLVEPNVVGALNANFAFYMGLADGGAFDAALTQDQILMDVWDQEPDIRANTSEWLYSFLLMAYAPMADADIQRYIEFSQTDDGKVLNIALFDAFDAMFTDISYDLGRAAARVMDSQDL